MINVQANHQAPAQTSGTESKAKEAEKMSNNNINNDPEDLSSGIICKRCDELKISMAVLQDNMISMKEEMLSHNATTELILSTPSTSGTGWRN